MSKPTFLSFIFTIAVAIVALLWWAGALHSQVNSLLTILVLSFCGTVCGAFGLRYASNRMVGAVCLVVSGLVFFGIAILLLQAAIGLSGIKG
jgi:hypothetical protein